jgi:N-acetylglucosaminyldiphosphoundecaprenol N-acetyl-beta-D-mannosaminyltransferase
MDKSVRILGIEFSKRSLKETVEFIDEKLMENDDKTFHIITANPEIALDIERDTELKKISLDAGLITADGIGIILASKLKKNPLPERVTGYELLLGLLKLGNEKGLSFYFFGSSEEVNKIACENILRDYPNIKLVGRHNGYFKCDEELKIVEEIENTKPDFLIVALGAPFADKWIYKHKARLSSKITLGVGGSLDVISGKVKRAPILWQRLNLEWLFRLISNPTRLKRQMKLPVFAVKAIAEALKKDLS